MTRADPTKAVKAPVGSPRVIGWLQEVNEGQVDYAATPFYTFPLLYTRTDVYT